MTALLELLPPPVIDRAPLPEYDVRVLTVEEASRLAPVFTMRDVEPPDPANSFIVGAVTPEGEVSNNFLVAQIRVHAEPLHLTDGHEHLFRRLARTLEFEIANRIGTCDVFLFAPPGRIESMALAMGMEKEPWCIMSKHVVGFARIADDSKLEVTQDPQLDLKLEEVTDVVRPNA